MAQSHYTKAESRQPASELRFTQGITPQVDKFLLAKAGEFSHRGDRVPFIARNGRKGLGGDR